MMNAPLSRFLEGCFRLPHDNPPRWLLMLTAYIDETGQEQDDWMFLAGYYGTDSAWRQTTKEWKSALGPQRKRLHMKSLRFKLQSERKMLERLAKVPGMCGLVPMLGGVRFGDYRDILKGTPDEVAMNGYVVCLWSMLYDTLRCLPEGERLEIVFEAQDRYAYFAEIAIQVFTRSDPPPELLLADGTPKLASWRWVPKDSTSLLEPADYLCYALAKYYKDAGSIKDQWCRPILREQEGEGFGHIMPRDKVRMAINGGMKSRIEDARKAIGSFVE
jgi:hypothetical protein